MGKKKVRRRFGNELVRQGKPFVIIRNTKYQKGKTYNPTIDGIKTIWRSTTMGIKKKFPKSKFPYQDPEGSRYRLTSGGSRIYLTRLRKKKKR